jgi:polyisoprenoid-binding protein YceI
VTTGAGQASADEVAGLVRDGSLTGRWTLDQQASTAEFRVRHFWNAITVRGRFERMDGEGTAGPGQTVAGKLVIDATSLNTKNKKRDAHLRSADFFDAEKHPQVVLTVTKASVTPAGQLAAEGTLEAAGITEPVTFTADVLDANADSVTLRAEFTVDRSRFGMTWGPLRMTSMQATGSVTARFTRVTA